MSQIDADVIVVGGGFAGVTAAREAAWRGLSVILLEGRDRLGGRTWTADLEGSQIELGGTWVHWFQPHLWTEITRYDQPIYETPQPEVYLFERENRLERLDPDETWPRLAALWDRMMAEMRETLERPSDPFMNFEAMASADRLSMSDRIAQMGLSRSDEDWIKPYLAAMAGSSCEEAATSPWRDSSLLGVTTFASSSTPRTATPW